MEAIYRKDGAWRTEERFSFAISMPLSAVAISFGALCLLRLAATLLPTLRFLGKSPTRLAVSYGL